MTRAKQLTPRSNEQKINQSTKRDELSKKEKEVTAAVTAVSGVVA